MKKPMALETAEDITEEIEAKKKVRRNFLRAVDQLPLHTEFTCDTLAEVTESVPVPQNRGRLYRLPEFQSMARAVGYTKSVRTGGICHVWVKTTEPSEDLEAAA